MAEIDPLRSLVDEAKRGDRAAFDRLAERFAGDLCALIRARLGPGLRENVEIEDLEQETLHRAFEGMDRFEPRGEGSFLRWLSGIAHHVVLQQAERFRVRGQVPLERDLPASGVSPSGALRREERFERLEEALAGLDHDHREVIRLARIERLPSAEIARRLGRSPGAVAQLLVRALRKLRESFGDTDSLTLPPRSLGEGGPEGEGRREADREPR